MRRLSQSDIVGLEWFLSQASADLSGLAAMSFQPAGGGARTAKCRCLEANCACDVPLSFMEQRLMGSTTRDNAQWDWHVAMSSRLVRYGGTEHWRALTLVHGPPRIRGEGEDVERREARRDLFTAKLEPLVAWTPTARIRATFGAEEERLKRLRLVVLAKMLGTTTTSALTRGQAAGLLRGERMAPELVRSLLDMDARTPAHIEDEVLVAHAYQAIHEASQIDKSTKGTRDPSFLFALRTEARALYDEASDAWGQTKSALLGERRETKSAEALAFVGGRL